MRRQTLQRYFKKSQKWGKFQPDDQTIHSSVSEERRLRQLPAAFYEAEAGRVTLGAPHRDEKQWSETAIYLGAKTKKNTKQWWSFPDVEFRGTRFFLMLRRDDEVTP